ncbi:hypothetical protein GUJ93_ZPchr0009g1974 [Zizania palustris]|uniref:Uncharacterized protein n=1 Tax=Zizania palustris TaxID=103762 RepID=A0A8J5RLQ4_ZIZPA|nr:hypothetical protein GUJ93_ZPchr0009g1974 [Zizania palustris]
MPSPLKRSIAGRLGRLLASLRSPAHAGPLPVQTGFPTSLADLVVRNHDRLKKPKRRRPRTTVPSSPMRPVAAVEPQPRLELSPVHGKVGLSKGVAFSLRPGLLAVGGAATLALLVIWSKWLVAAVTVASLSLSWIESVRNSSRRWPRPRAAEPPELPDLCVRGRVSPIREVESEASTPRSSCVDSDKGSNVSSVWAAERIQLDDGDSTNPKRKEKKMSLRKLIAKRLHSGKKPEEKDSSGSPHDEVNQPDAGEVVGNAEPTKAEEASVSPTTEQQTPSEPSSLEEATDGRRDGALPFAAFVSVVLVGLVAGKLPAVALTVLCAVFFSSVE